MLSQERPPIPRTSATNPRFSYHADNFDSVSSSGGAGSATARKRITQHSFPSLQQQPFSKPQQQALGDHPRLRSSSIASTTAASKLLTSPEAILAKEKEFMANTRILAMSNLLDSFSSSSHSKQGFYGKQLKIIGTMNSSSSSTSSILSTGSELDITVKIHIIDNTWTTCPLLPSSTILHRWNITYLNATSSGENEYTQEDYSTDLGSSKGEKDASWTPPTTERIETISPASSPTYDPRPKRPFSVASASSFSAPTTTPETHVAVISNALCFVANRAGDYLVHLSIHVPFVAGTDNVIYLSQIPKCRINFLKFQLPQPSLADSENIMLGTIDNGHRIHEQHRNDNNNFTNGFDFNVHPPLMSLEEAHLNPESDEDAQFWLEVQEQLVGREEFVEKLVSVEGKSTSTDAVETIENQASEKRDRPFEVVGCFAPSSSLHISWMSRSAINFVQDIEQDITVHIQGMPDQNQPSSLLQDRRRKDPAEIHAHDTVPDSEELAEEEYDHLEMDDGDLIIAVEDVMTVNIQKLGWKQPFMDVVISLKDLCSEHGLSNDISVVNFSGDAVQNWEAIPTTTISEALENRGDDDIKKDMADEITKDPTQTFRVWFFTGTEGTTIVNIHFHAYQGVNVGYGKDIVCHIPKVGVVGTSIDKGRINVYTNNDLTIRNNDKHLAGSISVDALSSLGENVLSERRANTLHFQYQTSDYCIAVIARRFQALARIARIERVRVEIGLSAQQQPGFARAIISNIVLPQQEDHYLRLYQLDGAEIWSVLVDGYACSKSIQRLDQKASGKRIVLVPLPEELSRSNEALHQVEISYGFNSFDLLEKTPGDGMVSSAMKLVVPGFGLPVGEYIVVANLPKLPPGMDYEEPTGDFEVMSTQGQPGQRKIITYGTYMSLGRPKLSFRTITLPSINHITDSLDNDIAGPIHPDSEMDHSDQQHGATTVHDPQQPSLTVGNVIVQQVHHRHPQQPPQNPHAEQGLDREIPTALSSRVLSQEGAQVGTSGHGSNLAPQIGAPALQAGTPSGKRGFSLDYFTSQSTSDLLKGCWRLVMIILSAFVLVVMIINVAAFQETRSTSLDLVTMPAWSRPFVLIKRYWSDSRTTSSSSSAPHDDWDIRSEVLGEDFVVPEKIITVTTANKQKDPQATTEASSTRELEIFPRSGSKNPDPLDDDDIEGRSQRPKGLMKILQALKDIVQGLKR
ncbi:hypothetical protein FBU30_000092 [Linnemannia zychae]|nr:hypothetical protein FBU30_000092 [Linnemannia zychae]